MLNPSEVSYLLQALCIDLGFCLPPDDNARLVRNPPATPDEFTREVFRAEGMDIALADRRTVRAVRECVDRAFELSGPS